MSQVKQIDATDARRQGEPASIRGECCTLNQQMTLGQKERACSDAGDLRLDGILTLCLDPMGIDAVARRDNVRARGLFGWQHRLGGFVNDQIPRQRRMDVQSRIV